MKVFQIVYFRYYATYLQFCIWQKWWQFLASKFLADMNISKQANITKSLQTQQYAAILKAEKFALHFCRLLSVNAHCTLVHVKY